MNLGQIEKISKALADETRLKIYEHIAKLGSVHCGGLVKLHGVTPATVSHHLKTLSEAGLISCHREGQFIMNEANPEVLEEFTKALLAMGRQSTK